MQQWFKDHVWMMGMIASALAFTFTTFASIKYVDDKDAAQEARIARVVSYIKEIHGETDRKLDRMEDKIDRLVYKAR